MFLLNIGNVESIVVNLLSTQIEDALKEYKEKKVIENLICMTRFTVERMEIQYPSSILTKDCFHDYLKWHNIFRKFVEFYIKVNDIAIGNTPHNYISNEIDKCLSYMKEKDYAISASDKSILKSLFVRIGSIISLTLNGKLSLNELYMLNHIDRQLSDIKNDILKVRSEVLNNEKEIVASVNENLNKLKYFMNEKIENFISASSQIINNQGNSPILNGFISIAERPNVDVIINTNSENPEDLFKINVCVKCKGLISKFNNTYKYLDYIAYTGKEDELEVVSYTISFSDKLILQGKLESLYTGPICNLPTHITSSMEINSIKEDMPTTFSQMLLYIKPPIQTLLYDIENEENEILIENLEMGITRKPGKDILEVRLNDLRKNSDVKFDLIMVFKDTKIISTKFIINVKNKHDVKNLLSYYQLIKRLSSSPKIIMREKSSIKDCLEANVHIEEIHINDINKRISFYRKILRIQDRFKVKFVLPKKFSAENIRLVNEIYELLKTGIARTCSHSLKFKKSDMENNNDFYIGAKFLFYYTFEGIKLFGQLINFNEATMIFCKTVLEEITKSKYIFNAEEPCLCIWNEKYGDFDPVQLATDEMMRYIQEK